jgi:hypothetical protein
MAYILKRPNDFHMTAASSSKRSPRRVLRGSGDMRARNPTLQAQISRLHRGKIQVVAFKPRKSSGSHLWNLVAMGGGCPAVLIDAASYVLMFRS